MFIRRRSVASIMSDFYRKVDELEFHSAHKLAEVAELEEARAEIQTEIINATYEADKATSTAAKLREILG